MLNETPLIDRPPVLKGFYIMASVI